MPSPRKLALVNANCKIMRTVPLPIRLQFLRIGFSLCAIAAGTPALGQTTTTTSLVLTSGGNAVTTVSAGSQVTLTATVVAGTTPLKQGQVNFCDAAAAQCSDVHVLGTSQLNSLGKAILNLRPGTGSYSYKAEFSGTPKGTAAYRGSVSSTLALTVTGIIPSVATIVQSGNPGDYTLIGSALGFTKSSTIGPPTGTISLLDTTTNNTVLGTGTLAPSGPGPAWVNVSNPAVGNLPGTIVAGDFNGDGNLDLAVGINSVAGSSGNSYVTILLGDGQGHFTAVTNNPITAVGTPQLVQDFNGDGIPDLLISSLTNGTLTVLLGNGDGTFKAASGSPFATNYGTSPVVAGDFNGDGIPDLAVAGGYYLVVYLGKGDGTFTEVPIGGSTITGADSFNSMVVADYNGDGIPDLAAFGSFEGISVYFGNGDGTFRVGPVTVVTPNFGATSLTMAGGDFNGDGKADLAAPIYSNSSSVAILLGNGDGTFTPASGSPLAAGSWSNRVAVGDFNGDGVTDIFVGDATDLTDIYIFLGKGDGTFTQAPTGSTQLPCCSQSVFADFNGDGVTDIVSSDFYGGAANVLLTAAKQSSATISNIAVTGVTPHQVVVNYPGDTNYSPSESSSTPLLVLAATPAFTPTSGTVAQSQTVSIVSSTPGVNIYYQASGALITNGFVLYTGPIAFPFPGNVTIQAYAGGYNYGQSATSSASYTVVPVPVLNSMTPAFTTAGGSGFTLTVNGTGFVSTSTVNWGTTALATQFVSPAQLTAQVVAAEIANPGITQITVNTPVPGGDVSNTLAFEVDSGNSGTSPSFTTASQTVMAGSTASYPVTLPSSATNVTVSCLNMPSGASCNYSGTAKALTITTTASTPPGTYQITAVFTETLPGSASALAFAPFLLLPLTISRKKRRREHVLVAAFVLALLAFVASGCGGGSGGGGTPPTHQVTISSVVTLNVQ
jgi:FG-GAP-like repeat/Bacterial Ig-like domain (group 3)/Chitobiase/beta-hexosaminidase C-terminal domain